MPWLILLLFLAWLLDRAGLLGSRRPSPPPPTAPPDDARAAASAWSTYVPAADQPDAPAETAAPTPESAPDLDDEAPETSGDPDQDD